MKPRIREVTKNGSGILEIDTSEAAMEHFEPGDVIADKFVVERVLGVGGVGIVVAAKHIELDEVVAIKFLLREMQKREDIVRRFAHEARAAVRIKSEHVARVFDVGFSEDRGPYFVMEYLEGKNLADLLEIGTLLPSKRIVEYVLQVCEALAVAHSHGIVHRDIKPENLFLARREDGSEIVKVLDFGISKASLTGDGAEQGPSRIVGTPLYMSPEQLRGSADIDHRSDIWSLGVVLYELLTRRPPFPGDTIPKICAMVLETEPPPLSRSFNPPQGLQAVVDRCFAKDPAKRYQNVAELAIALLPYAPARGTVFAERTSTIVQAAGHVTGVTVRLSSEPPSSELQPTPITIPGTPPVPSFSGAPTAVSVAPSSRPSYDLPVEIREAYAREQKRMERTSLIASALLVVGVIGACTAFFVGRSVADSGNAAAPPSPEITITVEAQPAEAKLFLDDAALPTNPSKRTMTRDGKAHALRAEAPGYVTRSIGIAFDGDKEVVLALPTKP